MKREILFLSAGLLVGVVGTLARTHGPVREPEAEKRVALPPATPGQSDARRIEALERDLAQARALLQMKDAQIRMMDALAAYQPNQGSPEKPALTQEEVQERIRKLQAQAGALQANGSREELIGIAEELYALGPEAFPALSEMLRKARMNILSMGHYGSYLQRAPGPDFWVWILSQPDGEEWQSWKATAALYLAQQHPLDLCKYLDADLLLRTTVSSGELGSFAASLAGAPDRRAFDVLAEVARRHSDESGRILAISFLQEGWSEAPRFRRLAQEIAASDPSLRVRQSAERWLGPPPPPSPTE